MLFKQSKPMLALYGLMVTALIAGCGVAVSNSGSQTQTSSVRPPTARPRDTVSPAPKPSASDRPEAITIDASIDETFGPPPTDSSPQLSADDAWARFANAISAESEAIPSGVSNQLGLLTLPSSDIGPTSDWTYTAHDELAWGYSSASPCQADRSDTQPSNCTLWTFLDASTGVLIDQTTVPDS